jgi:glutathione synthase/RimK-type ligase-like ATP-grasp enzyme
MVASSHGDDRDRTFPKLVEWRLFAGASTSMNANLVHLLAACESLGIAYTIRHESGNLVEVRHAGSVHFFSNMSTPLNDHAMAQICQDKEFFYRLSLPLVRVPATRGYVNPFASARHREYVQFSAVAAIVDDIAEHFSLPVIIKKNRGSIGTNVFRCDVHAAVESAVAEIFNPHSAKFDYVALAQEHIEIAREYRVLYLDGELQFAYEKNIDHAEFVGNLSPLHWRGARALLVEDAALLERLRAALAPLFASIPLRFCGLDVAIDQAGLIWLIEANAAPGFAYFIADGGGPHVTRLYQKMLTRLFEGVGHERD